MSDLRPIIAGAFAGGLSFLGLHFAAGGSAAPDAGSGSAVQSAVPGVAASLPQGDLDALAADGVELAMSVASLREEVRDLRAQLSRGEVRQPVGLTPLSAGDSAAAMELAADFDALPGEEQRDLVLQVLEEERLREEQERDERRRERSIERAAERADELAEELGLSGADRDTLAEILTDEVDARDAMFAELGDVDWRNNDSRDTMREMMDTLRESTRGEIELRLGSGVADAWGERGGRGGFPGGGGRGGGRGGF